MNLKERLEYWISAKDKSKPATTSATAGLNKVTGAAKKLVIQYATMGAAAMAARSVFREVKEFVDYADRLDDISKGTEISTELLSGYSLAAKRNGVTIETLAKSMHKLAKSAYDAEEGLSTQVLAFQDLGVEWNTQSGELKDVNTLFLDTIDALSQTTTATERTALAQALLGRSGKELLPLIREGAAGIEAYMQRMKELGIIISTETAKAASLLNDRLDETHKIIKEGIISEEFLYAFVGAATVITDARVATEKLSKALENISKIELPDWLKQIITSGLWGAPLAPVKLAYATLERIGRSQTEAELAAAAAVAATAAAAGPYTYGGATVDEFGVPIFQEGHAPALPPSVRRGGGGASAASDEAKRLAALMAQYQKWQRESAMPGVGATPFGMPTYRGGQFGVPDPYQGFKDTGDLYSATGGWDSQEGTAVKPELPELFSKTNEELATARDLTEKWAGHVMEIDELTRLGISASVSTIADITAKGLVDGTWDLKDAWKAVLKQMVAATAQMLIMLGIQTAIAAVSGGSSMAGGGASGILGGLLGGGKGHGGGHVTPFGIVPRLHGGGMMGDEYLALLQRKEFVWSRQAVANAGPRNVQNMHEAAKAGKPIGGETHIHITNQFSGTPDRAQALAAADTITQQVRSGLMADSRDGNLVVHENGIARG